MILDIGMDDAEMNAAIGYVVHGTTRTRARAMMISVIWGFDMRYSLNRLTRSFETY